MVIISGRQQTRPGGNQPEQRLLSHQLCCYPYMLPIHTQCRWLSCSNPSPYAIYTILPSSNSPPANRLLLPGVLEAMQNRLGRSFLADSMMSELAILSFKSGYVTTKLVIGAFHIFYHPWSQGWGRATSRIMGPGPI